MPSKSRPKIPTATALRLRREAGFGCCKCGSPIIQYQHIIPWSEREHYEAEHMMVLCPSCHYACGDDGAYTREQQYEIKANPYNIAAGHVQGTLTVPEGSAVLCGFNFFDRGFVAEVDGKTLLSVIVDGDQVFVSGKIYDAKGNLLAEIQDNEWISDVEIPWDVQAKYQYVRIKNKDGDICLDVDARDGAVRVNAELFMNGHVIVFDQEHIGVKSANGGQLGFHGNSFSGVFRFFIDTASGTVGLGAYPSRL